MKRCLTIGIGMLGILAGIAQAAPVGETHRVTSEPTASLRDAKHRAELRITVWYPAAADAVERPLVLGPPEQPLFAIGAVSPDAAFAADAARWPVILCPTAAAAPPGSWAGLASPWRAAATSWWRWTILAAMRLMR